MSKKYIKAKVTLLPTNDYKLYSILKTKGGMLRVNSREQIAELYKTKWKPYEMYITTNEKVVKGDWFLFGDKVLQSDDNSLSDRQDLVQKIIATTDCKLKLIGFGKKDGFWYVSSPPMYFLKEYCDKGGINDIMVEYFPDYDDIQYNEFGEYAPYKLNVDNTNTIVIKPIKNSWKLDEVKSLMWKSWRAANVTFHGEEELREEFENWYEKIEL